MTLLKLITHLRRDILHDLGGHNTDWELDASSALLKWSNEELVAYINEAEREVVSRVQPLITDSNTPEVVEVSVDINESEYELHPSILSVRRAKTVSNDRVLDEVSWKDLESLDSKWDTRTGTPDKYILDWQTGILRVHPTPTVADTIKLSVRRYPIDEMTWDCRDNVEPEIPTEYQYKMLYWAAHLAYEKDEPNTLDPNRSTYFANKFEIEFGPREDVYSRERKKRPKRQVRYGGI